MSLNLHPNTQDWLDLKWYKGTHKINQIIAKPIVHSYDHESAPLYTIDSIKQSYPSPFFLCCTAGVDSQAMLHAWLKAHNYETNSFIVVSFMYNQDCNQYDMNGLQEICDRYNVKREIVNFDLMHFIDSGECLEYQIKYYTESPQMAAHIKMFESLPQGTALMSGELTYKNKYTSMTANHFSVYEYAREYNKNHTSKKFIPFFFEHDSIIATAHWNKLSDIDLIDRDNEYRNKSFNDRLKSDYQTIKCKKYTDAHYPIIPQTAGPYGRCSGFYKFKELYENTHSMDIKAALKYSNQDTHSNRMFDINLRYKTREYITYNQAFKVQVINQ